MTTTMMMRTELQQLSTTYIIKNIEWKSDIFIAGQLLVTLTMGKDSRQGEAKLEAQKLTSGNEDVQS